MEEFFDLKQSNMQSENKMEIKVIAVNQLGVFEITRVKAMQPKALRSGVESTLKMCKSYKTLN